MPFLPPITWPEFLSAAPFFRDVIGHGLEQDTVLDAAPLHRAAWFYGVFDAEVSNGGVMQYLYNHALVAPGFDRAAEYAAENPVLVAALPFMRAVHAAWDEVPAEARKGLAGDSWPETLFARHDGRFAALEAAFFAVNHAIGQCLAADIVARPHEYFAIERPPGVPDGGTAHVTLHGTCHLYFEDGFPVGPNILEREHGGRDVVWFSRDRTLLFSGTDDGGALSRTWLHYPTLRGGAWTATADGRRRRRPTLALWTDHGLQEAFGPDGSLDGASFCRNGQRAWSEGNFHSDGTPGMRTEHRAGGDVTVTRWPGGGLNTESVDEAGGRARFLRCLDEAGRDLAPGGTGRLCQTLGVREGRRRWREGTLAEGYLDGVVRWMSSAPDGGDAREDLRATYRQGKEAWSA